MIEVDFEVYKALTNRRQSEGETYNDVVRQLLDLGSPAPRKAGPQKRACVMKGVTFPHGTKFRVTYKGKTYGARIEDGTWIGDDGLPRNSPSEAAHAITGNSKNGWTFWEAKRPDDQDWRVIGELRIGRASS